MCIRVLVFPELAYFVRFIVSILQSIFIFIIIFYFTGETPADQQFKFAI
jgi:hypothetical protein